jgi:cell division protein FtsQ
MSDTAWDIRLMRMTTAVLLMICFVMLTVLAIQWLANRGVFAIERLKLTGDLAHVNPSSVRAQANAKISGSFFTMDLQEAKRAFEQLPWVRQAVVKRVWPRGIAVSLQAHQPVALWTTVPESGSPIAPVDERLLNSYAEVFEANTDEVEEDLPHLSGPAARAPRVWEMYGAMNERLQAAGLTSKVSSLTLTARSEWEVELDDGLTLSLGRDDDKLWERVDRYTGTVEQARAQLSSLGQRASWAHIDLRHAQGYAIALRNAPAPAPAPAPAVNNKQDKSDATPSDTGMSNQETVGR